MKFIITSLALLFIILSGCDRTKKTDYAKLEHFIEEKITELHKSQNLKGVSVGFVDINNYIIESSIGNVDNYSHYMMASVTKIVTGLAIMQLVEDRKLKLSDPVSKHIPEFSANYNKDTREITVVDLLTHSSGLSRDIMSKAQGYCPFETNEIINYFNKTPKPLPVAYRHSYSNPGFELLGKIIENVSGKKYPAYIRKYILDPLEMNSTFFNIEKDKEIKAFMRDYDFSFHEHPINYIAAGGLISNVSDMLNLTQMFLKNGKANNTGLINSMYVSKMFKKHNENVLLDTELEVGLPFFLESLPEPYTGKLVYHGGGAIFFNTMLMMAPDYGIGVVVFSNTAGSYNHIDQLARSLMLEAIYLKTGKNQIKPEVSALTEKDWPTEEKNKIIGIYVTSSSIINIVEENGVIIAKIGESKYPVKFNNDGYFSFHDGLNIKIKEKESSSYLFMKRGNNIIPIGKKESLKRPVSNKWKNSTGVYNVANPCPDGGAVFYESLELRLDNDILKVYLLPEEIIRKTYGIERPTGTLLEVINDTAAVMKGFGRYPGEHVFLGKNGNEVRFSGLKFIKQD